MQAASLPDGFSFHLFPPFENGLTAPEVDVSRRQVVQALVISTVVVVPDQIENCKDVGPENPGIISLARRRGDRVRRTRARPTTRCLAEIRGLAISPTCSGFRSEPWRSGPTRPGS